MLEILAITFPIYVAILIGFIATRMDVFTKAEMRVFGTFVMKFALPALVFKALAQRPIGEILNGSYMLAYATGSLAIIGLGYGVSRRLAHQNPTNSTVYVMGIACSARASSSGSTRTFSTIILSASATPATGAKVSNRIG
jgi:malonate transporter